MVILFTVTVFLAAALLFGVQPMVAKALLPDFGGGSSVWTTCMLYFQTLLIGGYLYAHLLLTYLPRRAQMLVHGVVLAGALVVGWLFFEPVPPPGASEFPVPWLLGQLFLLSGLPYFAISSAGPLLQGWFARTDHRRAHDPYFLYAASNAGSFVGLLAYPIIVEPTLGLSDQRAVWLSLFGMFAVLGLVCAGRTRRGVSGKPAASAGPADPEPITWKRRLWWVFLAFVPSTTLLGVTTHLTTDVASFPLLWVVPLALYLLTMIVAFSGRAGMVVRAGARPMVVSIIAAWVLLVAWDSAEHTAPIFGNILIQLSVLLTVGLYGHSRLALDRPSAGRLTEFYLLMSIGGAAGGLFNGVIAPLLFEGVYEYHLALFAALLMLPGVPRLPGQPALRRWARRLALPLASGLVVVGIVFFTRWSANHATNPVAHLIANPVAQLFVLIVPPALIVYMGWRDRASCAGAFLFPLAAVVASSVFNPTYIHKERTFYGVHKVQRRPQPNGRVLHWILNGTTMHGMQFYGDPVLAEMPLGYYHPAGPCGAVMRVLHELRPERARICVIGLGSGAMVTHGRPGDEVVFMEIDPAVERIARDTRYFTFLADARADVEVRLGDGRLLLERSEAADEPLFDAVYVDAFSSDSIPTHLLTTEAIELYFDRITRDGMVALHISNRHLDLLPLIFALAREQNVYALMYNDVVTETQRRTEARYSSTWAVLTASPKTGQMLLDEGFSQYSPAWTVRAWTDQYSNILSVIGRR